MPKKKRKMKTAKCERCLRGWPIYASSPKKRCPVCNGRLVVEEKK